MNYFMTSRIKSKKSKTKKRSNTKPKVLPHKNDICNYLKRYSAPVGIFNNEKKQFIYCNDKFLCLSGLNEDECYALEFRDFTSWLHPDDHSTISKQIGNRI